MKIAPETTVTATVGIGPRDDGKGFDPRYIRPPNHGLSGMRHRVEAAGGRLTVSAAAGAGTRILAALPKRADARVAPVADGRVGVNR